MSDNFSHLNNSGEAIMVDVSTKGVTGRTAVARGVIAVGPTVFEAIEEQTASKGDVLAAARIAGIFAAKKTWDIIPLCHPLQITSASIDFQENRENYTIAVTATIKNQGQTGVEMEALTAVSVALLTIYDMCKAMNKAMVIGDIHLESKAGGKSGDYFYDKKTL